LAAVLPEEIGISVSGRGERSSAHTFQLRYEIAPPAGLLVEIAPPAGLLVEIAPPAGLLVEVA
jgi:hypothetical protein